MNKVAIWATSILLIVYFIFTSGLYYWASGNDETAKFIIPFSWSLSALDKGFTPIATQGDLDCIQWVVEEGDNTYATLCDSSGAYLMTGWWGRSGVPFRDVKGNIKMFVIFIQSQFDKFYVFVTDWNYEHSAFIDCADIGTRRHHPYTITQTGEGLIMSVPDVVTGKVESFKVREVYRSGNSFIYAKD